MRELLSNVAAKICAIVLFAIAMGIGFLVLVSMDIIYDGSNGIIYADGTIQDSLYQAVVRYEDALVPLLIICLAVVVATIVFLLCAAGKRKDSEDITLNFLDKVPLDLYLLIDILLFVLCINVVFSVLSLSEYNPTILPLSAVLVALLGILVLAFLMTCSTRFKIGKWWRNSIIYMWLAKPIAKFLSWLGRQLKKFSII